ncbi:MAG TPA: peptide ABC transporter substrate-binding protein, partial [Gemmatimonadales bacterium]|nr:peptide ABC transporter substrate-binding protein [Gemmatimonadales bacterium]
MRRGVVALIAILAAACGGEKDCPRCDTIVIAATGEPEALLPPLVVETVGRDVSDQIFERLADLKPDGSTIDPSAYAPRLAQSWERLDSLTWKFTLRSGARWHDGRPITASDVVFSFNAFADTALQTAAGDALSHLKAEAPDEKTILVHFDRFYGEQLYDATWHVRIIPSHIWSAIPVAQWAGDTAIGRLVGSGPYRIVSWTRGQALTLVADTLGGRRARIGTAVWRFADNPEAALSLVLSGEADLMEAAGSPDRVEQVERDTALNAVRYPSAAVGYLGYRLGAGAKNSALTNPAVRRALGTAVNRAALATAAFGPGTVAPPGPMSKLVWIWDDNIKTLPYDTAEAATLLDGEGWKRDADGMRRKGKQALTIDILVPSTSAGRRRLAEGLQEQWRLAGVSATVTAVDFPVFQERLGKGNFESFIGAWLDEPSPRGLADFWTTAGIGGFNYGRYSNPVFDRLLATAMAAPTVAEARGAWRAAMDTLNADAPAIFLYSPVNV